MSIQDDYAKDLADEVLSDMAENFFGTRKQLDKTIDLFFEYVGELKKKQDLVEERFRFLNYLLMISHKVSEFYEDLGVQDTGAIPREGALSEKAISVHAPSAFTLKGKYVKLVMWAYETVQKGCKAYNHGMDYQEMKRVGFEERDAYYDLVMGMHHLINQEIRRVNAKVSPSHILQTAKRFDPDTQQKEHFTGGGGYYGDDSSLNRELNYEPIDKASLNIPKFPDLPELDRVEHQISKICKDRFRRHSESIRRIIREVHEKIREKYE
jgi:hypothetical protein